jgi:hypothetical protein
MRLQNSCALITARLFPASLTRGNGKAGLGNQDFSQHRFPRTPKDRHHRGARRVASRSRDRPARSALPGSAGRGYGLPSDESVRRMRTCTASSVACQWSTVACSSGSSSAVVTMRTDPSGGPYRNSALTVAVVLSACLGSRRVLRAAQLFQTKRAAGQAHDLPCAELLLRPHKQPLQHLTVAAAAAPDALHEHGRLGPGRTGGCQRDEQ